MAVAIFYKSIPIKKAQVWPLPVKLTAVALMLGWFSTLQCCMGIVEDANSWLSGGGVYGFIRLHQAASGCIRLLGLPYRSSCFLVEFLPIDHFFLKMKVGA